MRIEHVAIWTPDLDRLRAFYERYLGARAGARYENAAKGFQSYFLGFESGPRLELMHRADVPRDAAGVTAQRTGLIHVAFTVGDERAVDALAERLRGDGHPVIDGPRRTGDGYYECVALDPDGNRVEITAEQAPRSSV
jgi:lactoylglutathione lyase